MLFVLRDKCWVNVHGLKITNAHIMSYFTNVFLYPTMHRKRIKISCFWMNMILWMIPWYRLKVNVTKVRCRCTNLISVSLPERGICVYKVCQHCGFTQWCGRCKMPSNTYTKNKTGTQLRTQSYTSFTKHKDTVLRGCISVKDNMRVGNKDHQAYKRIHISSIFEKLYWKESIHPFRLSSNFHEFFLSHGIPK